MSIEVAPAPDARAARAPTAPAPARPPAAPRLSPGTRGRELLASGRTPLLAFGCSRLLVLGAGAVGTVTLRVHDSAASQGASRLLGPVGNVLAASVDRFDAGYYLDIAAHGFGVPAAGRAAFFPLYPLLIRLLSVITGSAVLAGALISSLAFAAALVLVHRLAALELSARAADVTVWLLAVAPLSFFFTAIYTESLFLGLEVAAVLAARCGRWRTACALGAMATLTRPVGILLAVALVALRLGDRGCGRSSRSPREKPEPPLAWVLALPAVLAGYLGLLAVEGYGFFAPFHAQAQWGRVTTGPLSAVLAAVWAAARGGDRLLQGAPIYEPALGGPLNPGAEAIVLFVGLAISLAALVACRRCLPAPYAVFGAAVLLVTLSSPATGQPLWSQDRFALVLFPLWMAVGDWLSRRPRLLAVTLALSAGLLVFYTAEFASWSFIA